MPVAELPEVAVDDPIVTANGVDPNQPATLLQVPTGQVMVDLIAGIEDVAAVGGLTMGADPIASAVLHQRSLAAIG